MVTIQNSSLEGVTQPLPKDVEGEVAEPEGVACDPLLLAAITRVYTYFHIKISVGWRSSIGLPAATLTNLGTTAVYTIVVILDTSGETA
jgi:hypothetical protein